jgi:lysozyme
VKTSQAGIDLIKQSESCRLVAYYCPSSVLTNGWGHTKNVKPGKITQAEADKNLAEDLVEYETAVNSLVKVPLTQNQFDALVSIFYNCGARDLAKSTLLRKLNAKDYKGCAEEFHRWNKANGKVLEGLTRRRLAESKLFLKA